MRDSKMAIQRRLVIGHDDYDPIRVIDLTNEANASASTPLTVTLEALCDQGHWHREMHLPLPCWPSDPR